MYNCTPLNKGTGKFETEGFFDILDIKLNKLFTSQRRPYELNPPFFLCNSVLYRPAHC